MKRFYQTNQKRFGISVVFSFITLMSFAGVTHFNTVWSGENGQNHMNFLVVSAIHEDLPLAANDEIAIFSGTKCVGAVQLTKAINPADNTSFITVSASQDDGMNNGFTDNDTILFKIWNNANQREMLAKAVTYRNNVSGWTTNGKFTAGATAVVELVSYVELTQTIQLIKGYNMISTYVNPQNPDVSVVTKSLVDQNLLLKLQDEAGNSFEDWGAFGGWINKVGSMEKTKGYKIKVAANCEIQVTGRPIVTPLNISLKAGWNIISFPKADPISAQSVVQPLIDSNVLVKVQDESGNSLEDWGVFGGWKNGIGNFVAGKAYKVKVKTATTLTLEANYLKSAIAINTGKEQTEYFQNSFEGNGIDHMNINIVGLREAGFAAGDELAAFDGNICVGSVKLTSGNIGQGNVSLIASASTGNKDLNGFVAGNSVKIYGWKKSSQQESSVQTELISGQMNYEKSASILINAKLQTTGLQSFANEVHVDVFPNPSAGRVNVRFSQFPENGGRIDIIDLSGRKVLSRMISGISEEFNLANQPAGIYLVKTSLGNAENIQKLMIN